MQMLTLHRLLADELEEVYRAELIVQEALPRMEKGAANDDLKKVFTEEADKITEQLKRLELVFSKIAESPRGGRAKSMKTLLSEFEDRMGDGGDPPVIDAALIAAGRRILGWGIASYACSQTFAKRLGMDDVAGLLGQTLAERQAIDNRLAQLAETIPVKGNDEAS